MTDDINTLLKRMEKLERGNRWLKLIVSLVLCAVLAMFFVGASTWNKEIVTENLKLVDEKGNTQAELSGGAEEPLLTFYDPNKKRRIGIGLVKGELGIAFFDPNEKTRVAISLVDGTPGIALTDSNGTPRMVMGLLREEPGLVFFDSEGNQTYKLP